MFVSTFLLSLVAAVSSVPAKESYKDQFCTDPRTMQKHAAYSEWADAYSCTRHRCQPGGRNLAIYTVGCKRVEAPESAIECEEVVEDTNMQFPFCCTRLRCLVVVRGEVWTRVLGQPWETLPAAPWSHMYKMKKPPPPNQMLSKTAGQGPIYELAVDTDHSQKVLRASEPKKTSEAPDCNEDHKALNVPDIVIALATDPESKQHKKSEMRHKSRKSSTSLNAIPDEDASDKDQHNELDFEDATVTEKVSDASEEKAKADEVSRKSSAKAAWTEIPQKEWNEQDPATDQDNTIGDSGHHSEQSDDEKGRPALQALVDAIGTRMRDIENVVQKMSEKVRLKPEEGDVSAEKRMSDSEIMPPRTHHKSEFKEKDGAVKPKMPNPDSDHYKRFSARTGGSKYLHGALEATSEPPLFVEDAHLNGYFSDASNSVLRRGGSPKEPVQTYMAPVETHHKMHILSGSQEKRRRKHSHKKGKGHRRRKDKRQRFSRLSAELDSAPLAT